MKKVILMIGCFTFLMPVLISNAQEEHMKSKGNLELLEGKIVFYEADFLYLENEINTLLGECQTE